MKQCGHICVTRIGGFSGFSLPGSHLQSRGEIVYSALSADEVKVLESLFQHPSSQTKPVPDGFQYQISHHTGEKITTIELNEADTPLFLKNCVKDELID